MTSPHSPTTPAAPHHLLIDARVIQGPLTGIARYTRTLLQGLAQLKAQGLETSILLDRQADVPSLPELSAFTVIHTRGSLKHPANRFTLPALIKRHRIDTYITPDAFAPPRCPCRVVIVLHDVIPLTHAHYLKRSRKAKLSGLWKHHLLRQTRRADAVVTVSQHSRRQLVDHLHVDPGKLSVAYPAIPTPPSENLGIHQDAPPYLLTVGRADPYKNLPALIHAFSILRESHPTLRLIIVGPIDARYPQALDMAKQLGLAGDPKATADAVSPVTFTGPVSDRELESLYCQAAAFAFPSLAEGFGLPPLEALARGIPVVAHPTPAARETLKGVAVFADATQPVTFARAMHQVLMRAPSERAASAKAGQAHALRFTPTRQATSILAASGLTL